MTANDYSAYVLSAYGVSALVLLALGLWILVDARRRRGELRRLEESGIRRRSSPGRPA